MNQPLFRVCMEMQRHRFERRPSWHSMCFQCFCLIAQFIFGSTSDGPRWRHQMKTFSALLALCAGKSPVTDEFPSQRPVTRVFDVSFDLRLNERLSKQSWGWWFETPSRSLWRHCNAALLHSLFWLTSYVFIPTSACASLEFPGNTLRGDRVGSLSILVRIKLST